jgi:adenylate kinase family enzyme
LDGGAVRKAFDSIGILCTATKIVKCQRPDIQLMRWIGYPHSRSAQEAQMRIVVVGTSGAGKTSMAKSIASMLNLPCVELDRLHWGPNWEALTKTNPDEFVHSVSAAISADAWVSDGNYDVVRDLIWPRATHLIWLDYSRAVVMYRVIKRSVARAFDQKELWAGNREDWRQWLRPSHPIRWAWSTFKGRRLRFEHLLEGTQYSHLCGTAAKTVRCGKRGQSA